MNWALSKHKERFELSEIKAIELAASKIPGAISLAQGIPSFETPQVIKSFVEEKLALGLCDRYSLTLGLTELREEISLALEHDKLRYDPDSEIIVTAGAIEAISATLLGCTSPGDEVIIPTPTYASYATAIKLSRCVPRYAELDEDRNFDLDLEKIKKLIGRKTRAIFYCNPNNPTGTIFSKEASKELLDLAERHNLLIITDEAYKDFYFTSDKHFTPALLENSRERVVRICSFSKSYAMTGWRVGYLHSASQIVQKILPYHDSLVTCAPVVSQYAAIAALRYAHNDLENYRQEFKKRRDFAIACLDRMSHVLDYQMPRASYFVFPRIKDTVPLSKDSKKLAYQILDQVGLALVPGFAFGPSGESHLRINFGRSMQDLENGMERLENYFARTPTKTRSKLTSPAPQRSDSISQRLISYTLALAARIYLRRNKMLLVGIAGIRGKTVFKRTIAELLSAKYKVRSNPLSFNTAIGFPLAILKLSAPQSIWEKLGFGFRLIKQALFHQENSEVLVLEYGVRTYEDAEALSKIALPDWLVLTDISSADPSLNLEAIKLGISTLVSRCDPRHVFWSAQDKMLLSLNEQLDQSRSFDLQAIDKGTLVTEQGNLEIQKDLPGQSYRLAAVAATKLAQKLDIPLDSIKKSLSNPE